MSNTLQDYFYLNRAGRYAAPMDSNSRLPLVYGDLTDGSLGVWELPCIDSTNFVYCFAGHEVLSVANGNSISIYENDLLLDPGLYSFDEVNNYESLGNIAIIDFPTTKAGSIITARGKGKPTATGGATLMTNIIDIVYDFLTVHNSFSSTLFESTAKSMAGAIFTAQGYKAGGVVCEDAPIWEILQNMIGSFLGSAYLNGDKELVLEIDNGLLSQYGQAGVISKSDLGAVSSRQRLANLINCCPASYAYDYVRQDFRSHSTGTITQDAISQSLFGIQKPTQPYRFYWCRDLATVLIIQAIIVAKYKNPLWEIAIEDMTLKRIPADVGNIITASIDTILDADGNSYVNQLWRVVGITQYPMKRKFRALDTGYFMTMAYLADGSHLADGSIKAGGDRETTAY